MESSTIFPSSFKPLKRSFIPPLVGVEVETEVPSASPEFSAMESLSFTVLLSEDSIGSSSSSRYSSASSLWYSSSSNDSLFSSCSSSPSLYSSSIKLLSSSCSSVLAGAISPTALFNFSFSSWSRKKFFCYWIMLFIKFILLCYFHKLKRLQISKLPSLGNYNS